MNFVPAPALAKIALLVLSGLLAAAALRRTPAHARHDVWLLVVTGTAVLPLAGLFLPAVFFKVPASWVLLAAPSRRGVELIALVWAAGALVTAVRFATGLLVLRRIGAHMPALPRRAHCARCGAAPRRPDPARAAARLGRGTSAGDVGGAPPGGRAACRG